MMTAFELLARRLTGMTLCVCGHVRADHREVAMSVALPPNPTPLYKLPSAGGIAAYMPGSTLVREDCHCGCTSWTPDDGRS